MRNCILIIASLLLAQGGWAQSPWQSLAYSDARVPAPFEVRSVAAGSEGYWLVDGQQQLHRLVHGQIEPAFAPSFLPSYDEIALFGLPRERLLIVGSLGLCDSTLQPCATEIRVLDEDGKALGDAQLPGRCSGPVVAAEGEFSLACDGQLFRLSAEADVLERIPGLPVRRYQHTDHAVMADGSWLVVVRNEDSVGALSLEVDGHPRWQHWFQQTAAAPLFSDSHLFLRLISTDGPSDLRIFRAADGFATGGLSIADSVTAATVWLGQLWLGLENAQGEHHLDAFDVTGAMTSTLYLGADPLRRLAVNEDSARSGSELLLGLGGVVPKLGRLDPQGSFRTNSLGPISSVDEMLPLTQSQVLIVATPLGAVGTEQQVEVRDVDNQAVAEALQRLPAPVDPFSRGTIDPDTGELWSVGVQGVPYLLQVQFSDGTSTAYTFESSSSQPRRVVVAPVATATHYCALVSGPDEVLCAPRAPTGRAFSHVLPFSDVDPFVALGSDREGQLNVLNLLPANGQTILVRSVVTEQGFIERFTSEPLPSGFLSLGGLRGLLGGTLLVDGERVIAQVLGSDRLWRASVPLPDGGVVLASVMAGAAAPTGGLLERFDADGQRIWSAPLPAELQLPNSGLRLVASDASVLVEPFSAVILSGLDNPSRALYSLTSGELQAITPAFNDDRTQFGFMAITAVDSDFWRLSDLDSGTVAQRISASQPRAHVWLPCRCDLRNVATGADGRSYFEFRQGQTVVLGVAELPALATAQTPTTLAYARLHVDGHQISGLLPTLRPGSTNPLVLLLDQASASPGHLQSRWDYLLPGSMSERSLSLDRRVPVLARVANWLDARPEQWSLLPLAGPAWLLRAQGDFSGSGPARFLQSNPQTAETRVYFADGLVDYWIAVDEASGEGAWGLPDGRWYRLQRLSAERWSIAEVSGQSGLETAQGAEMSIGVAALRTVGCGQMDWRLLSLDRAVRRTLGAELGASRQLRASCGAR
ncbi:MAG: hypothetical protein R3F15_19150 [Lysobacterales bacterium]